MCVEKNFGKSGNRHDSCPMAVVAIPTRKKAVKNLIIFLSEKTLNLMLATFQTRLKLRNVKIV
jgi:hypothetical protein